MQEVLVTKDIPANVVAAGNPCRIIKEAEEGDRYGIIDEKNGSNPLSKNIDELLDGMNQEREETKEGTYEESLKKIEERIKELGILEEENED